MEDLRRDLQHAVRALTRKRRFTVSALLSLGIGIGLTTAVFSFVYAVLLRPLPYRDPERVALIWGTPSFDTRRGMDGHLVEGWRTQSHTIEDVAVLQLNASPFVIGSDDSNPVQGGMVGTNLFSLVGASPLLGRTFSEFEDEAGGGKSVILSSGLWKSRFAGDPGAIGRTIRLNDETYVIVGVMPPEFFFPDQNVQLWVPLTKFSPMFGQVHGLARLRPGVTPNEAQTELDALSHRQAPTGAEVHPGVFSLYTVVLGKYETALWTLLGAVSLLLLLACANVSNLLLAKNVERDRELAVRASLGASRASLLRLLLIENMILSMVAGALGIVLAYWGVHLLAGLRLASMPRFESARVDVRVLIFALGLSLVTGVLSGLAPGWAASRPNLLSALQSGGGSTEPRGHGQTRDLLVTIEVAVALLLMVSAGLMINSFIRLVKTEWGFNPDHVLLAEVGLKNWNDPARSAEFADEIVSSLSNVPGVTSSAVGEGVPVEYGWSASQISLDGKWIDRDWTAASVVVGPDYFQTLGIPLLRGREFDARDGENAGRAVVVSKKLAEKLWPGMDPIGRQFETLKLRKDILDLARKNHGRLDMVTVEFPGSYEPSGAPWQVVGEVGDVRMFGLDFDPYPTLYVDYHQRPWPWPPLGDFVVRTSLEPQTVAHEVQARIQKILDTGIPGRINDITTMSDLVSQSVAGRGSDKLLLVVSTLFGGLSLLLTATGIYSVVSLRSVQRTREIGIRKTLGAQSYDIVSLILGQGMRPVLFGFALGLAGSFAVTRLLKGLLFGVTPTDPLTYSGISILLVATACAACLLPALRALRVHPAEALRHE